ncbi:MAG: transposase [Pseudomonadota bacterium]
MREHGGHHNNIAEVVCDMSPAFPAATGGSFPNANVTVDWFHVVQLFTTAVDEVLKAADGGRLTVKQRQAITELETGGFATATATAWRLKEMLRWITGRLPLSGPPSGVSPTSPAMP